MDIQQAMKQAQVLQKKMAEMRQNLDNKEVMGKSGGGLVEVTALCNGDVKKIKIDDSLLKPEEKEMLEDLICSALNNARQMADQLANEEIRRISKETGIPENMLNSTM